MFCSVNVDGWPKIIDHEKRLAGRMGSIRLARYYKILLINADAAFLFFSGNVWCNEAQTFQGHLFGSPEFDLDITFFLTTLAEAHEPKIQARRRGFTACTVKLLPAFEPAAYTSVNSRPSTWVEIT
jgi:hypothetical protein